MSLHLSKKSAVTEQNRLLRTGASQGRSSGWARLTYEVRRRWGVLWEVRAK